MENTKVSGVDNAQSVEVSNKAGTTDKKTLLKGCLLTLAGALCWGANATVAKYMFKEYSMNPLWMVCLRQMGAAICFLIASYMYNRPQLKAAIRNKHDLLQIVMVGVFAISTLNFAYIVAIDRTNSATATVMQTLATVMVLVYTSVKSWKMPNGKELLGVALAIIGTFLLATGGNINKLELPLDGIIWGLITALGAALLAILPVKMLDKYGSFVVNGLAMFIVGIPLFAFIQPWNMMPNLDAFGIVLCILVVVIGSFGGYALFLAGTEKVGSMRASLIGAAEPLMAIITSMIFLNATYSVVEFIGFTLIILMLFLTA